jgi:molybdenum cofactor cytidylyltransferase
MTHSSVRPVLLAAGAGSRFAGPSHKLLAPLRGRAVVQWAAHHAAAAGLGRLLVVTGAVTFDADWLGVDAEIVPNPRWAEGQATSLQVAVASMDEAVAAMVVGLGDQPFVPPGSWAAVAASPAPVAVATYGGQRANPVRLARSVWGLLPVDGDQGARPLMRMHPELVIEVPCSGDPADIDSLEDLDRWNS